VRKRTVIGQRQMQKGYRYVLSAPTGRRFDPEFKPQLTPAQMLRLGVFGVKHWKAIRRHVRQVQKYCEPGDLLCRRRQRQALLHWAYDSPKI
jgi:hypothetical protein